MNINPRGNQQPVAEEEARSPNIANFQLPLDSVPLNARNKVSQHAISAVGHSNSTHVDLQMRTKTDIDDQYRDIPEIGSSGAKNPNQLDEIMINNMNNNILLAQQKQSSMMASISTSNGATAANTLKHSVVNYPKPSIVSSVQNMSAMLNGDGIPERTSGGTSIIELNSVAEAGPVSNP